MIQCSNPNSRNLNTVLSTISIMLGLLSPLKMISSLLKARPANPSRIASQSMTSAMNGVVLPRDQYASMMWSDGRPAVGRVAVVRTVRALSSADTRGLFCVLGFPVAAARAEVLLR